MATAEHREPYESRGSRTVLGARGGEIPLRDSPAPLFSYISQNWRAQPLVSYRVIVDLISATTTKTGLTVRCEIDETLYHKGITFSDAEMATINITRDNFHCDSNYTISLNSH